MSENTQKIGVSTATIVGINAMIGAGIFMVPVIIKAQSGPAGIVAYIMVVLAVWCMALTMSRVAARYPTEGSFYGYAKQWGGDFTGFIASATYILGVAVSSGLLCRVLSDYLHNYFPSISATVFGLVSLSLLVFLNMREVKILKIFQYIIAVCKVLPLIVLIIWGIANIDLGNLHPFMPNGIWNTVSVTKVIIFGFIGFESAATMYQVIDNPERNVPKALTWATLLIGLLYFLFLVSIMLAIPNSTPISTSDLLPDVIARSFPQYGWISNIIGFTIVCAIVGTLHSILWAGSLLLSSLTELTMKDMDVSLPPSKAVLVLGIMALISLLTLTDIDTFFNVTAILTLFSFVTMMITWPLKHRKESLSHTIVAYLGILTAIIMIVCAVSDLVKL